MIYNFPEQYQKALEYLFKLSKKKCRTEVKQLFETRSIPQNRYLHLLLGFFGSNFGYTIEESKQIYKKQNKEIYFYTKNDSEFVRSSADLDTSEMTTTIDRFRKYSSENGLYLPEANEQHFLDYIANEIEKHKEWL